MERRKSKKKFKFSKRKVIRNFIVMGLVTLIFFSLKVHAYNEENYKTIIVSRRANFMEYCQRREENK